MTRIGMGLIGPGFVGAHHIDAVRRLGFVDVVAMAASSDASARRKAEALGVPKAYGDYEALIADPDVHVVHNTTPNYLHVPVIMAALAHRKHVISDKPLAMTAPEARRLVDAAAKAGVVHAVTFNYRGNPLVQQAREMIAGGELGLLHFIHGAYLLDWLLEEADFSWRLEPEKGGEGSAVGDIGSVGGDGDEYVAGRRQERQNELWIGRRDTANSTLLKDPSLLAAEARRNAHLPGGHQEGWADAFCNVLRDIYGFIAARHHPADPKPPAFATFEDGYHSACVVDAILESHRRGAVWTRVGEVAVARSTAKRGTPHGCAFPLWAG